MPDPEKDLQNAKAMMNSLQHFLNQKIREQPTKQFNDKLVGLTKMLGEMLGDSLESKRMFIHELRANIKKTALSALDKNALIKMVNTHAFTQAILDQTKESRKLIRREAINFSSLPKKLDKTDLQTNGKLLSDEQIKQAQKEFAKRKFKPNEVPYLSKKILKTPYSILKSDDQLFAVYGGVKANKHLGAGAFGTAKLAQNLQSGEWFVLKVQAVQDKVALEKEAAVSKAAGLSIAADATSHKKTGDKHRLLMNLVKGESLESYLTHRNNHLTSKERLEIAFKALDAFEALHRQKMTHGDTEARNLMIDASDVRNIKISLIDFGSANMNSAQFAREEKAEVRQIAINLLADLFKLKIDIDPVNSRTAFKETEKTAIALPNKEVREKFIGILEKMNDKNPTERPIIRDVINDFKQALVRGEDKQVRRPVIKVVKEHAAQPEEHVIRKPR
ncbi:MAG: protein kinase [Gammaproteobacteria bacterium]